MSSTSGCSFCLLPETLLHVVSGCNTYLSESRYTWRHDSILNFLGLSFQSVRDSVIYADLPGFINPPAITRNNLRPDLLLVLPNKCLYHIKMATRRADVLTIAVICFFSFSLKRRYFISSDSIGLSIIGEELDCYKESFIMTSLWTNNRSKQNLFCVRSIGCILLLLCGDIHPCPGPLNLSDFAKQRGTKILHGNVRNLQSNSVLISSLLGIYPGIDILGLTETHITGDPDDQSVQVLFRIPGFTFLSRNRPTGKGGGVGMYLSSKMRFDRRKDLEYDDIECIWVEIICRFAKNFLVCCM